jgi:3-isopropylmalate/(R)-2-methylmalate dehydratase small subunit
VSVQGRVLKYAADDVNTDVIWPGKYTYVQIPFEEMPQYAMETFDPEFPAKAREHDVLVVGKNFGCGSSREQASECLKASGMKAIVAVSFARIFYRNSINLGLPVIECPEAVAALETGAQVRIDLEAGRLEVGDQAFTFPAYPPFVLELIRDGGLIPHIRKQQP